MMPPQKGLSLVEMLVALTIFSVIAASSVVILRLAIDDEAQFRETSARILEIELARSTIRYDLMQAVQRNVRDELGNRHVNAMLGGDIAGLRGPAVEGELLLAFVRNGRTNPGSRAPRSDLQYVEYVFRENQLIRRARQYLDASELTPVTERVLLDDISDLRIAFLAEGDVTWQNSWIGARQALTPAGFELTFDHAVYGRMRHLFHVGRVSGEGAP